MHFIYNINQPVYSSRELNTELRDGKAPSADAPAPAPKVIVPGGPGSQWRMTRLRRVYETADEEGIPVEQVALDRFGSLEAFEAAKDERRILDEREAQRGGGSEKRGRPPPRESFGGGEKSFMFNDSISSSRSSSFRRPGGLDTGPSTPTPGFRPPVNRRLDHLRDSSGAGSPLQQPRTPIPTVMTPPPGRGSSRALSPSSLNKLQAKVLRAKLMGDQGAEELEKEYEAAAKASLGGGNVDGNVRTRVEVLPTLDGHGRLYDVGHGKDDKLVLPGNRQKKEKVSSDISLFLQPNPTSRSKRVIPQLVTWLESTRMMIRRRLERCFVRRNSALACPTRRTWMLNLPRPSWATASSRMILTIWMRMSRN